MRGVMEFDDYNYRQYNPMVLIPEPQPGQKLLIEPQKGGDAESIALSEKTLDLVASGDYTHDVIDLPLTLA